MSQQAMEMIRLGTAAKGDILAVARIAAINSTKLTPQLIPLCHAIPIEAVKVSFELDEGSTDSPRLVCRVTCETTYKTGIEMEAMTGASVAALTVYDMLKSVDRRITIGPVRLEQKTGGASGDHDFATESS